MIMDFYAANVRVAKIFMKVTTSETNNKPTPMARLKLEYSFIHNGIKCFVLFCTLSFLNFFSNALLRASNFLLS